MVRRGHPGRALDVGVRAVEEHVGLRVPFVARGGPHSYAAQQEEVRADEARGELEQELDHPLRNALDRPLLPRPPRPGGLQQVQLLRRIPQRQGRSRGALLQLARVRHALPTSGFHDGHGTPQAEARPLLRLPLGHGRSDHPPLPRRIRPRRRLHHQPRSRGPHLRRHGPLRRPRRRPGRRRQVGRRRHGRRLRPQPRLR
mmetsp:Transcript_2240/g.7494  ORF Transcript_2240/g.7494 Transcript_2240/m.7494 type:complete len:200 (+) Transcript_2240:256-855(+)